MTGTGRPNQNKYRVHLQVLMLSVGKYERLRKEMKKEGYLPTRGDYRRSANCTGCLQRPIGYGFCTKSCTVNGLNLKRFKEGTMTLPLFLWFTGGLHSRRRGGLS